MIKFSQTKSGDITIRISGGALRHAVKAADIYPEGSRVTNTKIFSDAVLCEMESEEEDGTTLAHIMLDQAMERAIENGASGVNVPDED